MTLSRLGRVIGLTVLGLLILLAGAWCTLAVWYRAAAPEPIHGGVAAAMALLTLAAAGCLATRQRWRAAGAFAVAFVAVSGWWLTITPSNDLDWSPEGARTATAVIDGDHLIIANVRNFDWRTETDFEPRWETRTYSLSEVLGADLIMSVLGW